MKIVINKCYGGFSLSKKAAKKLECGPYDFNSKDLRSDPRLVEVVEKLYEKGKDPSGDSAALKVVEIPDDVEWKIDDYDGCESIHEVHRVWH